jgi:3D (Asp-Asp-Asp) domain-containing protein
MESRGVKPGALRRVRERIYVVAVLGTALIQVSCAGCLSRAPEAVSVPVGGPAVAGPAEGTKTFTATAYSVKGKTASGGHTHEGIVAADPEVLPIGSLIRVDDAGPYSGVYRVTDTGRAIHGHELDLFIPNEHEAKQFGKKSVKVQVLEHGEAKNDAHREAAGDAPAHREHE